MPKEEMADEFYALSWHCLTWTRDKDSDSRMIMMLVLLYLGQENNI